MPAKTSAATETGHQYRLPSWFNYYAFKRLYGKEWGSRFANELHKRIYLETALKVFEQRALYRLGRLDSLASINELSDLVSCLLGAAVGAGTPRGPVLGYWVLLFPALDDSRVASESNQY